ncbi:MAG: type IX secretion system protein PorQ [Reichenbachiella sp.]
MMINTGFLFAQLGGDRSFEFLNMPIGARVAGLGGVINSSTASDVNLFLSNPALLDTAVDNHLSWGYLNYYADVKYNTFAYAKRFKKIGMLGVGVQRLSYGEIDRYDQVGNQIGEFDAHETALVVSNSHTLGYFTMGVSLKYVNSAIDTYGAHALSMDLGGTFTHPEKELQVAVLFKNFGFVLSEFSATSDSQLPFDVQVGVTFKPKHMPFIFSMTAYNLTKVNGQYYDEDLEESEPSGFSKAVRHFNIGTEIILGPNVNLRAGYNYLVRQELQLEGVRGMSGVSLGAMIKVKAFEFSYTYTNYHADGGRSYFTVTSNLNRVLKKKSIL